MYNVSSDYLEKINSVSRQVYWYGTITLKNGTVYNFDMSNLKQGHTSLTRQLCTDKKIGLGGTCSSELKIKFMLDYDSATNKYYLNGTEVDRYDFYDAEITLTFRLYLDEGYEDVQCGTFVVSEPERTTITLTCVAYDYMQKFTKACVSSITGMPYNILLSACSACGMELGSTPQQINAMPNGRKNCVMYDPKNAIKTWRDVIGYVAAMLGGNAVIKADNKLYIIPYNTQSVRTISARDRVQLSLADYVTNYNIFTAINLRLNIEEKVSVANDGLTYALGGNPFIQYINQSDRNSAYNAILDALHTMSYVPFSGEFFCDPSFELGDVVTFTDNHAGEDTSAIITSITLPIGSHMTLSCEGDNPFNQKATETADKEYSDETSGSIGDGVTFYDYVGADDITIASGTEEEILAITYDSNGTYRQEFQAEVLINVETDEPVGEEEVICSLLVTYYINGNEIGSYHPEGIFTDGKHLLSLFYFWSSDLRIDESTLTVTITPTNGSISIDTGHYRGRIMQSGTAYVAPSNILEYIEVTKMPNKESYKIGETINYTGLVVEAFYEDGTHTDITSQCVLTPAAGTTVSNTDYIIVDVRYTKDGVTYYTNFGLEVVFLVAIEVVSGPTKDEYYVGENIDLSGLQINALYSDDTESDVTAQCSFVPANGSTITTTGALIVKATYVETGISKTCDIVLTVIQVVFEGIEITTLPTKTSYYYGQNLDYTGIVVTGRWSDGTTEDVTSSCTFSPAEGSTVTANTSTTVVATYMESGTSYTDSFEIQTTEVAFMDYVNYSIDHNNRAIYVRGIKKGDIMSDNLENLVIPGTYDINGVTYTVFFVNS